jgi:hypothetical protein
VAGPKFFVQHFVACLNAPWEGLPGPETPHTLETVAYVYGVPPDAEFPVWFAELWVYARLFSTSAAGGTRDFSVQMIWRDAPGGAWVVRTDILVPVTFRPNRGVVNRAWVIRPVEFPGPGVYEFRLLCHISHWSGSKRRRVASEFIRIEHRP